MSQTGSQLLAALTQKGIELWLEDGRLRYRAPAGVLDAALLAEMAARKAELMAALRAPRTAEPTLRPDPARRYEPFPLTDIQQAYWIGRASAGAGGDVAAYSYAELEVAGLDLPRLNAVVQRLIARHDMLRAVLTSDGQQRVLGEVPPLRIAVDDLRGQPTAELTARLLRTRERLSHQVLPAEQWPLFSLHASLLDGERVRLHFGVDLLIADALSAMQLVREAVQLYRDPSTTLPPLSLTFRDYVLADLAARSEPAVQRSLTYWKQRVATLPPPPELPLARHPDGLSVLRFGRRSHRLPRETWRRLREHARAASVTPSMALCAAYAEVLAAWSGSGQLTLNLTLFNRRPLHPEVGRIVGDFTSGLLLAVSAEQPQPFAERARTLQDQFWRDLEHAQVSSVQVLRELLRARGPGAVAQMPVVFTSLLQGEDTGADPELPADAVPYAVSQTPQVWLDHQVLELGGELLLQWDAVEELFPDGLLDAMFTAYCGLLGRLADDAAGWHAPVPALLPAAQAARRSAINATDAALPLEPLHAGFLRQAEAQPQALAVVCGDERLSYGELSRRSAQLAARLRQQGAAAEAVVAVALPRGVAQVVAVLAVLRAGAAYLPLDPELPEERRMLLLRSGGVQLVVTSTALATSRPWPPELACVCVDEKTSAADDVVLPEVAPEALAYVIYTSGSTGQPKGVMIEHRAAVSTIADINRRFAVGPADRVLGLSALSFDLSVYDLFGTFAAGAALVLPPADAAREPAVWAELVRREQVTVWNSVPMLLEMLVEQVRASGEELPSLRLAMLSGDWIPVALPDALRTLAPHVEVISLGGATEAAIWSIYYPIGAVDPRWRSIPYGRPLSNQRFYVLDAALRPRPDGVTGELYIGGAGLARGYLRDPERTAERFITHPQTGERLYRTGDLGRYLPSGDLELLGRTDGQVKLRGFRIELGEIEAALGQHPQVAACAAALHGTSHRALVAYMVHRGAEPLDEAELTDFLRGRLPEYMVPARFVALPVLPLSANGKLDRRALPPPPELAAGPSRAPQTPAEERLCALWTRLLGGVPVGVQDDFFALGGDSLLGVQLLGEITRTFGVRLSMRDLFGERTVAALGLLIEERIIDELLAEAGSAATGVRSEGTSR